MFDTGVIIGRFQPAHKGHGYLIKQALLHAKQLIIIVGSSYLSRTLRNPLPFNIRKQILLKILQEDDFSAITNIQKRIHICPMPDYLPNLEDDLWEQNIISAVNKISMHNNKILLVGYYKDHSSYYLNNFVNKYNWELLACEHFKKINSTQIRQYFFENKLDKLQTLCYPSTIKILQKLASEKIFKELEQEYKSMQEYKKSWQHSPFAPIFVTCDALVICQKHILLIKRKHPPGKNYLAMPGGFIEQSETVIDGVIRELYEETNLDYPKDELPRKLKTIQVFDSPNRSSRGRVITHTGLFIIDNKKLPKILASDDAKDAMWIKITEFTNNPENIFNDHYQIINWLLKNYSSK